MKAESGNLYLLPSVRVPVLNSLNLRYRANTFSSLALVSGNLDITFSDDVTVSGSLNSNNFVVKNADGVIMPITQTIYDNKLRITKNPFQYMATRGKVLQDKPIVIQVQIMQQQSLLNKCLIVK